MPRKRTISDQALLDAALGIVRALGPDALTFAALAGRSGLAGSTIVQRFGTKAALLRAALLQAWENLEQETAAAIEAAPPGADGVIDLLVRLSGQYNPEAGDEPPGEDPNRGGAGLPAAKQSEASLDAAEGPTQTHDSFADQLLILREDLRDPVLRARGKAWLATLYEAIELRLQRRPGDAEGLGELLVTQWQGTLTVWSFKRSASLPGAVRTALEGLVARLEL